MTNRHQHIRRSPHANCRGIVTILSIFVCARIWITSAISLAETDKKYGHWIQTVATVVGSLENIYSVDEIDNDSVFGRSNITKISNDGPIIYTDDDTTQPSPDVEYCALLTYSTAWNEPVASVSDYPNDCSIAPNRISVGQNFVIRYNPNKPKQFIKQVFFEDEVASLGLMIAIGFALTLILIFCLSRIKNDDRNAQTSIHGFDSDDVGMGETHESHEQRRERIISKMIFQTIREDLSNTTADRVRALAAETFEEKHLDLEQQEQQQDPLTFDQTDKAKPEPEVEIDGPQGKKKEKRKSWDNTVQQNQVDEHPVVSTISCNENNNAESHKGNQFLQMFSTFIGAEEEPECCICLEKYKAGEIICASKNTECTHVFHKDCVLDWMKNHDQCPLCRTDMLK